MLFETLKNMNAEFFLMYSSSKDPNFYYATGFKIYDPVIYIVGVDGTDLLVIPKMEKRRAERGSKVKELATLEDVGYKEKLKETNDPRKAISEVIVSLLKEGRCRKVLIPHNFPAYLAFELKKYFEVDFANPFSKLRMVKRKDEIEKIRDVSNAIISVFDQVIKNVRKFQTCEDVRRMIELELFRRGYLAENTIASTGKLSADPHEIGYGKIEEHLLVDIFPRSMEHLYYSDFTRTVFLEENLELKEMYEAVVDAQLAAINMIRDGVDAKNVHELVKDTLDSRGFKTRGDEGFVHSTGHGVGLEIHEEPRISEVSTILKAGMVFTVEPGLYYKKVGGVRVEDTVVVRKNGCEILTNYPKFV